ncbi:MAG: type IV pilus modification protein PilV [Candidatus Competibacteraceae bacterium]|nr:type IV pilus modification protein PilV [Candidatus Competibacteraceae bacterium]
MVIRLRRKGRAKGFTLLEVMVALLILSVGLLGLAGLQLHALQYTHSSYQRTVVNIQALDMAERMWTHLAEPLAEVEAWQNLNKSSLPAWKGTVSAVAEQAGDYLITISWMDQRFVESQSFSFSYRLRLPKPN